MAADTWLALAIMAIAAHLLFNIWVVFGAAVTHGCPKLTGLHIASVIYGVTMENTSWPCPLTLAENWCKVGAGLGPYEEPFVLHYLHLLVAPNFPLRWLQWGPSVWAWQTWRCTPVGTPTRTIRPSSPRCAQSLLTRDQFVQIVVPRILQPRLSNANA